ncbi:MAG: tetratricopeptide repeat protein [Tagaea sp.]
MIAARDLVLAGFERHRAGDAAAALDFYGRALAIDPAEVDATHLSGMALRALGRLDEALVFLDRACALRPRDAVFHANRAASLLDAARPAEARDAARTAAGLDPAHAPAWINLAAAEAALGDEAAAEASYRRALALAPGSADARNNLANLLQRRGDVAEALAHYEAAIAAAPGHAAAHSNYGTALYALHRAGERAIAEAKARAWANAHPANATARHVAASLTGAAAEARAPDEYVRAAFDMFAPSFETTLAKLDYRAPQALDALLARALPLPTPLDAILDAGCGTGLAAPMLRPRARRLEGVDLSPAMVERARARALYDELRVGELTADLGAHAGAYDLIVAADVLCYFGDLAEVTRACARALKPGGALALSLERLTDAAAGEAWRVRPSGRYAHAADSLPALLARAGFAAPELVPDSTRREAGAEVPGLLVFARKVYAALCP